MTNRAAFTTILGVGVIGLIASLQAGCSSKAGKAPAQAGNPPELKAFKSSAPHDLPEALEQATSAELTLGDQEVLQRAAQQVAPLWRESEARTLPADSKRVSGDFAKDYGEWIESLYLESFRKHGNHDPRFEAEAAQLLKDCLTSPRQGPRVAENLQRGKKLFASGYHDLALRYLCAVCIEIETPEQAYEVIEILWPALERWDQSDYPPAIRYKIPLLYADAESKTGHEPFWPDGALLQGIADLAETIAAPLDDRERRFHLVRIKSDLTRFLGQHADRLFARLAATPGVDPWLQQVLLARDHIERAWKARGVGYADTVMEAGWKGFGDHLNKARALLLAAWEQHPDCPEAAAELVTVAMGIGGVADESPRFWFDQAVRAEFDHEPAYDSYRWSLRPRWGGSTTAMLTFARECLATQRFDTRAPWQFHRALVNVASELEDRTDLYAAAGVYEEYVGMLDGYRKDAKNDQVRRQIDSWHACMACLAGRHDDAKRLLDKLGSGIVVQSFTDFETTLSEMKLRLAGRGPSELMSRAFNPGVTRLAISADGRRLMALGPATGATLWELQDECRELPSPKGAPDAVIIRDADLSADGRRLALITFESLAQTVPGRLELWDVETRAAVQRFEVHEQFPACVRLSPNGRLLATGTIQGQVLFFDATTGSKADAFSKAAHQGIIPFLAFSPDGTRLASEDQNGVLKIWDLAYDEGGDLRSVEEAHTLDPFPSFAISFAFSPDGKQFLVGHAESDLWQLDPAVKLRSVPGSAVAFAPDGATFATGGGALGGSARVWETKTGNELCQLVGGHNCPIFTLIFSPNGKRIVSGSRDFELNQKGSVRCWNAATGEAVSDFGDAQ